MCGPASVRDSVAAGPGSRHTVWVGVSAGSDAFPATTPAAAERWAADLGVPAYAIDEQTAIVVAGGATEVVSEGRRTKLR
jgi:hypothetical protein